MTKESGRFLNCHNAFELYHSDLIPHSDFLIRVIHDR